MARHVLWHAVAATVVAGLVSGAGAQTVPADIGPSGPTIRWADVQHEVLDDDPQVRAARAVVQAAESRIEQLRSRYLPTLGVTASQGRSAEVDNGRAVDRRVERAEAVLRWNLYNGGADAVAVQAAELEREAAAADLRRARDEVAERLATAMLEVQRHDELVPAARARQARVGELARLVERQLAAGKASSADEAQAAVSRTEADLALEQLLAERAAAVERLQALLGRRVRAVEPLAVAPQQVGVNDLAFINPNVIAARQRAVAARAQVRSLQETTAPRVDLDMRRRLSDRTRPASDTAVQRSWTVTMSWDLPVGGETLARRDETQRRAEAAEAEADRALQLATADVVSLGPRIAQAESALRQLDVQAGRLRAVVRAGELQYEAGRRSLVDLIQTQSTLYDVEVRRADHRLRLAVLRLREAVLRGNATEAPIASQPAAEGG